MEFKVKTTYNLDVLNFLNVLTGDAFYTDRHKVAYEKYYPVLSKSVFLKIEEVTDIMDSSMIGPYVCLVISSVPDFENMDIIEMMSDTDSLRQHFSKYEYFDEETWQKRKQIFGLLIHVIEELQMKGFKEYWYSERSTQLKEKANEVESFSIKYNLKKEIQLMLGKEQATENIVLHLCSFAAPHGIKICGTKYISDISCSNETTLAVAIHEMFHPPYDTRNLKNELHNLSRDPFIKKAFETKDPKYGYDEMEGFIEENVVEAMALHVCEKLGLESDTFKYLQEHDGGSHVFSLILLEYFKRIPKRGEENFEDYFIKLISSMPVGHLEYEYLKICRLYHAI